MVGVSVVMMAVSISLCGWLRPRERCAYHRLGETQPVPAAAEENAAYGESVRTDANSLAGVELQGPVDAVRENADFSRLPPEHRGPPEGPAPDQDDGGRGFGSPREAVAKEAAPHQAAATCPSRRRANPESYRIKTCTHKALVCRLLSTC